MEVLFIRTKKQIMNESNRENPSTPSFPHSVTCSVLLFTGVENSHFM
jgi:hypothetical protein